MRGLKKYLVLALLSIFVSATTAGVAMAHCGHARAGDTGSMTTMGGVMAGHGAGHKAGHEDSSSIGMQSCHDMGSQSHAPSDGDDHSSSCNNCDGGVCQSPSITPVPTGLACYSSTTSFNSEEDIHLHTITLAVIPDPPKQLS